MDSVNFSFNSVDRSYKQTANPKINDSVNLQNSSNIRRDTYAKWAVISAIATVAIAGAAILICENGSSLGERDIQPDGYGVRVFSDGCTYTGNFFNNRRHGQGVFVCPSFEYRGNWKDDLQDGWGVFSASDGFRYEGQWREGKKNGGGIEWSSYGRAKRYYGEFLNSSRSGKGVLIESRGQGHYDDSFCLFENYRTFKGEWLDDKLIVERDIESNKNLDNPLDGYAYAVDTLANGCKYHGIVYKGLPHGSGLLFCSGSENFQYEGEWRDGKQHGKGIGIWPDKGLRYRGDWENGQQHGEGCLTFLDGANLTLYQGHWENGQKHGKGVLTHADGRQSEECWALDVKSECHS